VSGRSATRVVTKRLDRSDGDEGTGKWRKVDADVLLTATWKSDGSLELAGRTTGLAKETSARLVGTHAIAWP
jgi:hypothetical protein